MSAISTKQPLKQEDLEILKAAGWKLEPNESTPEFLPYLRYWQTEKRRDIFPENIYLLSILSEVASMPSLNKDEHYTRLQQLGFIDNLNSLESSHRLLNLILRLWLMVDVRRTNTVAYLSTIRNPVEWPLNLSFPSLLESLFPPTSLPPTTRRFPSHLNVANLELIGGFQVKWTNNIADHLFISASERSRTLYIFHHATFLQRFPDEFFPSRLLQETRRTIALLIPTSDDDCLRWLRKQKAQNRSWLDPNIEENEILPSLQVQDYPYWREKLQRLEEAFDRTQPSTLKQLWFDRRNRVQWATFWIAITVFCLTLVQCVTGIIQAWASIKALNC